jgi:nucleotide-binding universal stress UspA family protein
MFARILVAIDGSENSSRAADLAIDLAKKSKAAFFVISVVRNPVLTNPPPGAAVQQPVDNARIEGERVVQLAVLRAEAQGIKTRGEIIENVPSVADAILDYANEWKVDLVVVGTRGLSGVKKILLGSVSSELLSRASCSLVVVRQLAVQSEASSGPRAPP